MTIQWQLPQLHTSNWKFYMYSAPIFTTFSHMQISYHVFTHLIIQITNPFIYIYYIHKSTLSALSVIFN